MGGELTREQFDKLIKDADLEKAKAEGHLTACCEIEDALEKLFREKILPSVQDVRGVVRKIRDEGRK